MSTSSAQPSCSTVLNNDTISFTDNLVFVNGVLQDTIGVYGASDTITITDMSTYNYTSGSGNTITLTGAAGSSATSYSIGAGVSIEPSIFSWKNEEFVDCLPDLSRIEDMCKEYPGLAIAYEKFKTTYYLVKDEYDTPKDERKVP